MSEIDISKWELEPNGEIAISNIVGFQPIPLTDGRIGVRIEYVKSQAELDDFFRTRKAQRAIQIGFTIPQARELATTFGKMADLLEAAIAKKH